MTVSSAFPRIPRPARKAESMSASHEQGALGASLSDVMTHPQGQGASAARTAGRDLRKAVAELSQAVTLAHDDYMRLGDYAGWNAIQSAEHQITKLLDAALASPADSAEMTEGADRRPIATAPLNEEVYVYCGEMRFRAKLVPGASMYLDEADKEQACDQWQATREDEHPACWSEGACWSSNAEESPSMQPTAWAPISAPATPPGVPDSVRKVAAKAAFFALFDEEFHRYDEGNCFDEALIYWERDGAYPKMRETAFEAADAALRGHSGEGRTLISAHPAGQSTGLGAERRTLTHDEARTDTIQAQCPHYGDEPARCLITERSWAPGVIPKRCKLCPDVALSKQEKADV